MEHSIIGIEEIFVKMYEWVKRENYKGYDPYDWGSSPLAKKLPYNLNLAMSQFNLYSPINLRKIFNIEKGTSNKSLALFAQAYLKYYEVSKDVRFNYNNKIGVLRDECEYISKMGIYRTA